MELLNLNGEAHITHQSCFVCKLFNIARKYLTLAFVVCYPRTLLRLFFTVLTNCTKDINDKVKRIFVVVEQHEGTFLLENGLLFSLMLFLGTHCFKCIGKRPMRAIGIAKIIPPIL